MPGDASTLAYTHSNRLAAETSPYLLQHQHNPVDWYPWGPEAFERARREDKPIFLSVGYSTCYWCHVMERQCFENEAVAAEMNRRFVNVKVDREERPDVDQLYMTAVQVLTRHGGWPMSVWLTPDLRPFYGGTYYPPTDQHGRPGFVTLLAALEDAYRNRRAEVEKTADQLVDVLRQVAVPAAPQRPVTVDDAFVADLIERSTADYDPKHGGFGHTPKFPRETLLELLLVYVRPDPPAEEADEAREDRGDYKEPKPAATAAAAADEPVNSERQRAKAEISRRVLHTLDALAAGGIRDQLGGGFHRYSTDAEWLVPHFEIMLYDNAMLAWCYVEAFRQTGEPRYASVAHGVFDFVLREMTSPDGAFYTAFDAEVDGQEGLNYLWTAAEVTATLGETDARVFNHVYGLDRGPNFADPHHGTGLPDKNVLYLPEAFEHVHAGGLAGLEASLEPLRRKLKAVRDQRKQPLLDTKVLTSWNALMIRALAYGGQVLGQPGYVDAARRAADFLLDHHRTPDGGLYRTSRDGRAKYDGFLDDYAYLAHAMLALDEAGAGPEWIGRAGDLARAMAYRFGDDSGAGGFYFTQRGSPDLIVRQKTAVDSPLPSGNAAGALALLALGDVDDARATIAAFARQVEQNGEGMSALVEAALLYLRQGGEPFTVSAGPQEATAGGAAERPRPPREAAADVVRVSGAWTSPTALRVRLAIAPGFHINAHEPGGGDVPLVPTRVRVEGAPADVTIDYPPADARQLAFATEPIHVYEGAVTIVLRFATPVTSDVRLSVTYQACDDRACLPPVTKRIEAGAP